MRDEARTRTELIDPALYQRGWTEDLIRREVSAGTIEVVGGQARQRRQGRADYHTPRAREARHAARGGSAQ
jgi:type I restriction enzyme R subunit